MVTELVEEPKAPLTTFSKVVADKVITMDDSINTAFLFTPMVNSFPCKLNNRTIGHFWNTRFEYLFAAYSKIDTQKTLKTLPEDFISQTNLFLRADGYNTCSIFERHSGLELNLQKAMLKLGAHLPESNLIGAHRKL